MLAGCGGGEHHPAPTWHSFGPGHWPGAGWHPYGPDSPFNRPIPRHVRVHPHSRAIVRQALSWGGVAPLVTGDSGTSYDYGHPTYFARATDPVYRLVPTKPWGRSLVRGRRIHVPRAARPAAGGDGHMTVVEPDGWEYDFWQVRPRPADGGTMRFSWGGRVRIGGPGVGGGATAAGFGNLAGIIRAPELASGHIDHALFIVLRCSSRGRRYGFGARRLPGSGDDGGFVYPAAGGGARCPRRVHHAAALGARFQLDMSDAQIAALHAPPWKAAVLRALAHYGGYVGDTGGPGFAIEVESGSTYTAYGHPDPFVALARAAGIPSYGGRYRFDLAGGGVHWERHLRVLAPPRR